MKTQRVQYLFQQYLLRQLSPAELDELRILVKQDDFEKIIGSQLDDDWDFLDSKSIREISDIHMEKIYIGVHQKISKRLPSKILSIYRKLFPYAAVLALLVTLSYWFWNQNFKTTNPVPLHPSPYQATLTLQDGRTLELSEDHYGIIVGDTLTYQDGTPLLANSLQYKLEVPLGRQYQVTLPDGSHVWLNAGSSLRYPSKFDTNQRMVELDGEAYFQVKKQDNQARFLVKTSFETVEVLGTEFNISAYQDDPVSMTTLVTGSVRVGNLISSQSAQLIPGQQAVLHDHDLEIRNVNIQDFTTWREGIFRFSDESLENIMKDLSRWYDVEVVFQNEGLKNETFTGNFTRRNDASHILNGLEKIGNVKFKVDGRKILVNSKNNKY